MKEKKQPLLPTTWEGHSRLNQRYSGIHQVCCYFMEGIQELQVQLGTYNKPWHPPKSPSMSYFQRLYIPTGTPAAGWCYTSVTLLTSLNSGKIFYVGGCFDCINWTLLGSSRSTWTGSTLILALIFITPPHALCTPLELDFLVIGFKAIGCFVMGKGLTWRSYFVWRIDTFGSKSGGLVESRGTYYWFRWLFGFNSWNLFWWRILIWSLLLESKQEREYVTCFWHVKCPVWDLFCWRIRIWRLLRGKTWEWRPCLGLKSCPPHALGIFQSSTSVFLNMDWANYQSSCHFGLHVSSPVTQFRFSPQHQTLLLRLEPKRLYQLFCVQTSTLRLCLEP